LPKDGVDRVENEIDRSSLYNGKKLGQHVKLSVQPRLLSEQGQVEFGKCWLRYIGEPYDMLAES